MKTDQRLFTVGLSCRAVVFLLLNIRKTLYSGVLFSMSVILMSSK